ncbi:hypothetical protein [Mycobacterium aquaticum]|uniref:Uncharacterized protein n=1 Tax=Mycobacterium aquaticum TaxID=1927124 RepID=A0A1X0B895_9MYCO|nr:hypothetical protein [Mycobacterium aquaticum]ORA38076.1 hypothetical protein BST13_05610 [Mycobacterium aquaticum]
MSLTYEQALSLVHCAACGVPFGMTADMEQRRRQDHANFYCPAGHRNVFNGKSEAEKQRVLALRLAEKLSDRDELLRAERKSHAVTKGQLTKARNRIAKTAEAAQ